MECLIDTNRLLSAERATRDGLESLSLQIVIGEGKTQALYLYGSAAVAAWKQLRGRFEV
jgi:hypothetical protein